MTLANIWYTIEASISNIGWVLFFILVFLATVLWNIHPVLGILATLFIFALLMGVIVL